MTYRKLNCEQVQRGLPDYFEGSLNNSSVADLELHLASCASCHALVSDLQIISRNARSLPDLAPPRDLWPEIAARIETKVLPLAARPARGATAARWTSPHIRLGAAAAVLIAVTALATLQVTSRDDGPASPGETASTVTPVPDSPAVSALAPREGPTPASGTSAPTEPSGTVATAGAPDARPGARETFNSEISRLREVVQEPNNRLDPATQAVIVSSLRTVDSAIAEARAALARDPASHFLVQHLNKSLEQKLGLLRQAALLSPRT